MPGRDGLPGPQGVPGPEGKRGRRGGWTLKKIVALYTFDYSYKTRQDQSETTSQ